MGINMQLTQGSGFVHACCKEVLTPDCRVVLQKTDTLEFLDDFSGSNSSMKLNARKLLNVPLFQPFEVDPNVYKEYKVFLENKSKNWILKANSLFLYQVFPGNTSSWLHLLHHAIKEKQYRKVENLLHFFRESCPDIINQLETSSGLRALHTACQTGQFNVALALLESGASINKTSKKGHTALESAILGQHKGICQLLIEWGCSLPAKNIKGQKDLNVNLNHDQDLRDYCKSYSEMWQSIVPQVIQGNIESIKKIVEDHTNGLQVMASLRSRCIDGSTLLHVAAYYGEAELVETLLQLQLDVDILDYKGATALQRSRDVKIMQLLLKHGADVKWSDDDGNTALHMVCFGEPGKPSTIDCLLFLISQGASKKKQNKKGLQAVHCAAIQGRIDVIETIVESYATEWGRIHKEMMEKNTPSLPYLALSNNHLECTKWLLSKDISFKEREQEELLFYIIYDDVQTECHVQNIRFLISNGLNVNTCDSCGNSALHLAALRINCYEILQLLLSSGSEVDVQNDRNMTPLFNAIFASNFHGAKLLLDYGANVKHLDNQGFTAFAHIHNTDDWIACGLFSDDINELLKAYELQKEVRFVKHVANQIRKSESSHRYSRIIGVHELLTFRSLHH
ncbi:ankyrin repeat domain-containing protein 27-like [Pelobates fuscus]|uniref:ankyrin repeat domain-containing protein 27-like n=1 Tax=Pelobates fuscus TaxID=191477 RepID=UPI002FE4C9FC